MRRVVSRDVVASANGRRRWEAMPYTSAWWSCTTCRQGTGGRQQGCGSAQRGRLRGLGIHQDGSAAVYTLDECAAGRMQQGELVSHAVLTGRARTWSMCAWTRC